MDNRPYMHVTHTHTHTHTNTHATVLLPWPHPNHARSPSNHALNRSFLITATYTAHKAFVYARHNQPLCDILCYSITTPPHREPGRTHSQLSTSKSSFYMRAVAPAGPSTPGKAFGTNCHPRSWFSDPVSMLRNCTPLLVAIYYRIQTDTIAILTHFLLFDYRCFDVWVVTSEYNVGHTKINNYTEPHWLQFNH